MKTSTFIALFLFLSTTMFAQLKVVELPPSIHSNTTSVEIRRVTLSDTAAVLDIDAFFRPGWWIKIASGSYLLAERKTAQTFHSVGFPGVDTMKKELAKAFEE